MRKRVPALDHSLLMQYPEMIGIPLESKLLVEQAYSDESVGSPQLATLLTLESKIESPPDTPDVEKTDSCKSQGKKRRISSSLGEAVSKGKSSGEGDTLLITSVRSLVIPEVEQPLESQAEKRVPQSKLQNGTPPKTQAVIKTSTDSQCPLKKEIRNIPHIPPMSLPPNMKSTTSPQSSTTPSVPMSAHQLFFYSAEVAPFDFPSSRLVPSLVPLRPRVTTCPKIPVESSTDRSAPAGKAYSPNFPSRSTALVNKSICSPKGLGVPELPDLSSDMSETAHTGGKNSKKSTLPVTQMQLVNPSKHTSEPPDPRILPGTSKYVKPPTVCQILTNEASGYELSKFSETAPKPSESMLDIKRKMVYFERRSVQLEYRLSKAALKKAEMTKKMAAIKKALFRSENTIAKQKETIENRNKDIERLRAENKLLQKELDKLKPKPLKVYMPSDMVGSETNLELGRGKPLKGSNIIAFERPGVGHPNADNLEESTITSAKDKSSKSGHTEKRKFSPISASKRNNPPTFKKFCSSSTGNISNQSGRIKVESTVIADEGTIVYNLKPTANVKLKPKSSPRQSIPVQLDESEFQTIETLTEEGGIAYHLLRRNCGELKSETWLKVLGIR